MTDRDYMKRAIELAKKAVGFTNPNPMVGAVIVKNGRIIGEGYHRKCGELHAERNAFASLNESAEGGTIYVTLEPCCHYGKTPPCTEAIIENKISRVVIGSRDPNPLVSGKGARILREHGIEVEEDFMKVECDEINYVFFHYITKKTPYVVLKYAMTADGKIASKSGKSKWITGHKSRNEVHKMRHRYMGIMAGIGTVLADDPMLNVRIDGLKSPVRIIVDSKLRISMESQIVKTAKQYRTIVACAVDNQDKIKKLKSLGIEILILKDEKILEPKVDLKLLMKKLGAMEIDSVLVEGGGILNDSLRKNNLIDRMEVFIAPKILGGDLAKSPVEGEGVDELNEATTFNLIKTRFIDQDIQLSYERKD